MSLRRKTYIDPEVQGALARRLMIHWAIFIVIAAVIVLGLMVLSNPFRPIGEHLMVAAQVYAPVMLVLVCLAPVFVFDSVKLSNRFTGPMLRIRNATKSLAHGEPTKPINLRDGDFWKEVADDFNRVIERVEGAKANPSDDTASA